MKHISQETWPGLRDTGLFIMPCKMHRAYCGATVTSAEIDNEHPDCDPCMDAKVWEEIDKLADERDLEMAKRCQFGS